MDILATYTGHVLTEHGFSQIQEIMDHFWPGIMTVGCAAMADHAREEIARQCPTIKSTCDQFGEDITPANVDEWRETACKTLPPSMDLDGPVPTSDASIQSAFTSFTQKKGGN